MDVHLAPITAKNPHTLFDMFAETLDGFEDPNLLVRAGFAFVTFGGVHHFISCLSEIENWNNVSKEFLVGIYHAITEPSALEALRKIPNTKTRVFVPGQRLSRKAVVSKPVFHPKVLAVSTDNDGDIKMLQTGSPNLTSSAIGYRPQNHEFSLAIRPSDNDTVDPNKQFDAWWLSIWNQSRIVDRRFILKYAELREQVFKRNPVLQSAVEAPQEIQDVEYFFCEVGAGSGPPGYRHQIEFPESLVKFFGNVERQRKDITLKRGDDIWHGRPLSYKRTTFNVEIWRLGMPTQHRGGDPIAGRVIRYKRTNEAEAFEFDIVDLDSDEYAEWMKSANIHGHLGATQGNRARRYGFY